MSRKDKIKKALNHPDVLGAGAEARKHAGLTPDEKVAVVLEEFKRGALHSGGGKKVRNRKQAIAIALSEASRV